MLLMAHLISCFVVILFLLAPLANIMILKPFAFNGSYLNALSYPPKTYGVLRMKSKIIILITG